MKLKPPKLPKLPLKIPDLKFFNLPKAKQKDVDTNLRFRAEPLLAAFQGKILTKYLVDQATVFIIDQEGNGIYTVSEPELNPEEQRIYSLLIENLFFTLKPLVKIEDSLKYVEGFMWDATEELGVVESVQKSFQKYRYFITRDAFGYGPIHIPMKDPNIEEISCTGYGKPVAAIHRQFSEYNWLETNITFPNEDILKNFPKT
ncbi:MAG: hypothetical protein WDA42_01725, partial [Candidatus Bathyarchaeia archaeon]